MTEENRRTRLERFLLSRKIKPHQIEEEVGYSRQSLLRVRHARSEPRRNNIAAIVSALRRITLEPVQPEDVFELTVEESGVWRPRSRALVVPRAERERADAFVLGLTREPAERWRTIIDANPEEVTAGLIRALVVGAKVAIDRRPDLAAPLALLATELPVPQVDGEHLAHLRGRAFLEYGNALRHEGGYAAALVTLDHAETHLLAKVTSANELAQVWYVRAVVLWKRGQLGEARTWRKRARIVFELLGDIRRAAHADVLEAGILYEENNVNSARELWQKASVALTETRDHKTLAFVMMNLGTVAGHTGEIDEALSALAKAERLFKRLGVRPEMLRARWALGHVMGLHRSRTRGLQLLRAARESFLELRMPVEAAYLGFDLVDVLLLKSSGAAEAVEACSEMIAAFHAAGVNSGVAKAIAYLRDAVQHQRASAKLVDYVRAYAHDVEHDAARVFTPPEEG